LFTIAGISGGIPGFWNFRSSETSAYGGGVMVSLENYMRLMDVKNPEEPNMIIDKVFINLRDNSEESIEETKEDIRNLFQDSNFIIDDAISKINYIEEANERQSLIMEIILGFTIVICIFGLVSTMYAILLERKFEIGILRAIGLKAKNVRNMFLIESLIIMLSAGIMGMAIGTYTAYLLQSNTALFSEMPLVFVFPLETFLRVFIISITVSIIGMYLILLKLSKQTVMDVFRQSF
jgi:ABC-type antimicrobial peptide transport system permease subunit